MLSYHIVSDPIIAYHVISCCFISYQIISCHIISYRYQASWQWHIRKGIFWVVSMSSVLVKSTAAALTILTYKRRNWSWTVELSPPLFASPHVTTDPSARMAAKASLPPCTSWTFVSWCWTLELLPPHVEPPHVTTVPSAKIAAKAVCGRNLLHIF